MNLSVGLFFWKRPMKLIQTNEFEVFRTIGVVTGVTDGIVSIIGMSNVAYVKLLIF